MVQVIFLKYAHLEHLSFQRTCEGIERGRSDYPHVKKLWGIMAVVYVV